MIRTLLFYGTLVPSTLFFSLISAAGGLLGAPGSLHTWVNRRWADSLLAAAGVRVRVEGADRLPAGRPAILACNHESAFDIWGLLAALPVSLRFVAKAELSRIPVFARAFRAGGHVFVDRDSAASALETMDRAGRMMRRRGLVLVIFPEGSRSAGGGLRHFKGGAFRLARRTGAPIYPVALDGGGRILPRGRRLIRPGTLHVRVGEPVSPERAAEMDRNELAERIHHQVAGMLRAIREEDG